MYHIISILLIDNNYNTIRTFTDDELKVYESYNYSNLESQIVFGDSVALENVILFFVIIHQIKLIKFTVNS